MATLVLNRDSLSVKLEANHLVIHEHADSGGFRRMPLVDIDRVIVVGQPAITFPVFAKFLDLAIPCSFLSHGGRWRGVMDGDSGFHAERRMMQYDRVRSPVFALTHARQVVVAKISNCRRTIQRLAAERKQTLAATPEWIMLSQLAKDATRVQTVTAVRGVEGSAAKAYFSLLSRFFPENAPFVGRSRRPPRDAANALLSFVYTLVANEFTVAVRAHGLDVSGGFFHRGGDRSPALALDLMEPFRPVWGDRLVLDLLNHRRIKIDSHFEGERQNGVFLNDEGRRIVFRAFDEMMARRIETKDGRLSCRQIIDHEVCRFIGMLEDKEVGCYFRAA